jgi:glycosyltransferase involved in cell wall biosynthesis
MNSKISVIIPCGSIDKYFESALDSILCQTYRNIEVLVIANGLYIEDLILLREYCSKDNRVIVYNTDIRSLINALNMGIHFSSGDYIARMDCDDISLPTRLETQIQFFNDNPEYSVIGCRVSLIDSDGNTLAKKFKFIEHHDQIKKITPIRNVMCHPALMFKRCDLVKIGGYKFGFMSEDHELFIRMLNSGMRFHNINETLFCYRRHEGQITSFSKAWRHFIEISSFLFMHACLEKKVKYIVGIIVLFPPLRKIKSFFDNFSIKENR